MFSAKILGAAGFVALFCLPAQAACKFSNFEFHPERNDYVVVEAIVAAGTSCNHNFGEGPGYYFTGVTIERSPDSGVLTSPKKGVYTYTPAKDFHGKDAYGLKVCATKQGGGKGCSTIYYVSTVE